MSKESDKDKSTPFTVRLAELIQEDERTAKEIAAVAGVSDQYLCDLRKRRRGNLIPVPIAVAILRALGLSATAAGKLLYETHPEVGEK